MKLVLQTIAMVLAVLATGAALPLAMMAFGA